MGFLKFKNHVMRGPRISEAIGYENLKEKTYVGISNVTIKQDAKTKMME